MFASVPRARTLRATVAGMEGSLTEREWDVVALVARGQTNQEIAEHLGIGAGTVANHVERILRKLGLRTRTEVAAWVLRGHAREHAAPILTLLASLPELGRSTPREAITRAADGIAAALHCDKVDAFFRDSDGTHLVALGTSRTPMGDKQRALGLDRLPLESDTRAAEVFRTGQPYVHGHVERDLREPRALRTELGVRSAMMVPLTIAGVREGVLAAASAEPEFFSELDLGLLSFLAYWVGLIAAETSETSPD